MNQHAIEVAKKGRFRFGHNWKLFLDSINDERISEAEESLRNILGVEDLEGKRFLDAGCGSGLFSLAAHRLGAIVHSFDYDPESVACAMELKQRYFPNDDTWVVDEASVLDTDYIQGIGTFDIVYSWGVLHHTGEMWQAIDNIIMPVAKEGLLYIAIYNQQQFISSYWSMVKRVYNHSPKFLRHLMSLVFYLYYGALLIVADLLRGRNPVERHKGRKRRGMNFFRDIVDWIGGWPFEVASPEDVFRFCRDRDFILTELKTCGGKHGCNEFVFRSIESSD
jgi:2-polyprenyl-3-methyl-5-hydroxy-6-metoxy-1,4-benzoquinol methylase